MAAKAAGSVTLTAEKQRPHAFAPSSRRGSSRYLAGRDGGGRKRATEGRRRGMEVGGRGTEGGSSGTEGGSGGTERRRRGSFSGHGAGRHRHGELSIRAVVAAVAGRWLRSVGYSLDPVGVR
jgi:hypothetical protein